MPDQLEGQRTMRALMGKLMPPGQRDGFNEAVREADAARDAKRWRDATALYSAALLVRPDNAPILIQLGHAQKEAGDLPGAEGSYLTALALAPHDQDLLVQLGHFYKVQGDHGRALQYYQVAIHYGSMDPHARHYVEHGGGRGAAMSELVKVQSPAEISAVRGGGESGAQTLDTMNRLVPACYLDLTDLLTYFQTNRSPTGIQRVEIELLKAATAWRSPMPIVFCAYNQVVAAWVKIDTDALSAICERAQRPGGSSDRDWQDAIGTFLAMLDEQRPLDMLRGAVLIGLGPWWRIDYSLFLRHAKSIYGIRYVPVIYDLVPLITPEFLPPLMPAEFAHWLSDALVQADALAVISNWTQRDVMMAAGPMALTAQRPVVMPLDARFGDAAEQPTVGERRRQLDGLLLTSGGFVLCVGTLEARKNHMLLVQAWAQLIEQHGSDAVPVLVCAGRRGWHFEQTQTLLDAHPELAAKVMLITHVSDVELRTLYLECLFTTYTSTYEGWGLPVTESLCYGKACLTLEHSSLPEAGGTFADYSPPLPRPFAEKAWRLISDAPYRKEREQLIATQFRPRSWQEVLSGLVTGVAAQLATLPPPMPLVAPVEFGVLYETRHNLSLRQPTRQQAVAGMLRHGVGWHGLEPWGVWTAGHRSALAFRLPDMAGSADDLLIYLEVKGSIEPVTLVVKLGLTTLVTVYLRPHHVRQLRLQVPFAVAHAISAGGGAATLTLNADQLTDLSAHNPSDTRHVGLGLLSFAICSYMDTETRLRMIERFEERSLGDYKSH